MATEDIKSKPKGLKPLSAKPTPKEDPIQLGVEGFLVPRFYRNQSIYREHPVYKATLLALLLIVLNLTIIGLEYYIDNKNKEVILDTQKIELAEVDELQNQTTILKPIRSKYKEIEILRRQLRIPLSPILDIIEKTIPPQISINRINTLCAPIAATPAIHRKTQVQLEVYFPPAVEPTETLTTEWVKNITDKLKDKGLKLMKNEWGIQKKFSPTIEQGKRVKGEELGYTKELVLTIELSNQAE